MGLHCHPSESAFGGGRIGSDLGQRGRGRQHLQAIVSVTTAAWQNMGSDSQFPYEKIVHQQPPQGSIHGSKSTISFEAAYERELEYQRLMKMRSMNPSVDCITLSASPVSLKPLQSISPPRKRSTASSSHPQEALRTLHHQKLPPQKTKVQKALTFLEIPGAEHLNACTSNEKTPTLLEQPLKSILPPMKRKSPSPSNPDQMLPTTHHQNLPPQQLQDSLPYVQNHRTEHLDVCLSKEKNAFLWCNVCEVPCANALCLDQHCKGRKHMTKLGEVLRNKNGDSDTKQELYCEQCNIWCIDTSALAQHHQGRKHVARLLELKSPKPNPVGTEHQTTPISCNVCNIPCMNKLNFQQHLHGKKHKAKVDEVLHNTNNGTYKNQVFQCHDCNIWCQDKVALAQHEIGKKHAARLLELKGCNSRSS